MPPPGLSRAQVLRLLPKLPVPGCIGRLTVPQVNDNLSNGTDTGANTVVRIPVIQECFSAQFYFGNWYCSVGRDTDGLNDITMRAGLVSPAGLFVPIYFDSAREVVVGPGGGVWSDPSGIDFRFGDVWFLRTFVTVAAGGKWGNNVALAAAQSEGIEKGTGITDKTLTGSITASGGYGYSAMSVRSTPAKAGIPVIAGVGDSIMAGTGDTVATDRGWLRISLNGEYAIQVVAQPSDTNPNWTDNPAQNVPTRTDRRRPLLDGCTHAMVGLGRNTLTATAVDDANGIAVLSVALWNWLKRRGMRVYQTTTTPHTTSSDDWVTTLNQTVADAPTEANRVIWNTWLRDGAPLLAGAYIVAGTNNPAAVRAGEAGHPLTDVIETATPIESALNSGIWKAAYTVDGIHPNTTGHTAMSTALTPTIFGPIASAS